MSASPGAACIDACDQVMRVKMNYPSGTDPAIPQPRAWQETAQRAADDPAGLATLVWM